MFLSIPSTYKRGLNEEESILYEDVRLFQELADPDYAYTYKELVVEILLVYK